MIPFAHQTLSIVALQYELALLIGQELTLAPMLRKFFPRALKLLGCRAAHVYLRESQTQPYHHIYSYPSRDTALFAGNAEGQKMLEQYRLGKGQPLRGQLKDGTDVLIMPLGELGCCVILRDGLPIGDEIVRALDPILGRLALACQSCISFEETDKLRALAARNETRVMAMLESLPAGVMVIDIESQRFLTANSFFCRMLGYTRAELEGTTSAAIHPKESLLGIASAYLGLARGETNLVTNVPVQRKDGTVFAADINSTKTDIDGKSSLICVFTDITDRKAAERAKRDFISTVNHELRSPLTSIKGSLELLRGGALGDLAPDMQKIIDIAVQNCRRLSSLINDILDIERVAAGQLAFNMQRESVNGLLHQSLDTTRGDSARYGVHVILKQPLPDFHVRVDAHRFNQVLTNLISNAIKFSSRGATVSLGAQHRGHCIRITIKDQGPGVPIDFRDKVFDRFCQADSSDSRVRGGAGLGLAIAKELTEKMGGKIGFTDRKNGGTSFHVDLPVDESVTAAVSSDRAGDSRGEKPATGDKRQPYAPETGLP